MKVLIKEKLSPHKSKTPEGYLVCYDAILARTGSQDYYENELYPDKGRPDKIVRVDRKPSEVFSPETLASFENKPLTLEHPRENVGPDNFKDLAIGFVRNIRKGTYEGQNVMLGDIFVTDSEAIKEIEDGKRTELSCGYDCDITEGENPEQVNIRGNHVALCEQGRAGIAHIVDDKKVKTVDDLNDYLDEIIELNSYSRIENFLQDVEKFMNDKLHKDKLISVPIENEESNETLVKYMGHFANRPNIFLKARFYKEDGMITSIDAEANESEYEANVQRDSAISKKIIDSQNHYSDEFYEEMKKKLKKKINKSDKELEKNNDREDKTSIDKELKSAKIDFNKLLKEQLKHYSSKIDDK